MISVGIITIFPGIFSGFLSESIVGKSIQKNILNVQFFNPRDFADPPHYKVDDTPYGGGAGMVMKPEPLSRAIKAAKEKLPCARVIYLSPSGRPFSQPKAKEYSSAQELIFVSGRYEGIDQRIIDVYIDEELSIGDYVLMGGEVPTMVVLESVLRYIPEVLGNSESTLNESFSIGDIQSPSPLLEGPQYTKPYEFENITVPEVLISGNHKLIDAWRRTESIKKTELYRPDLLQGIKK